MKRRNFDNHSPFHKTGHTSKGDQRKWKVGDRWYKADYMGYESLPECLHSVPDLLKNNIFSFLHHNLARHPLVLESDTHAGSACMLSG